MTISRPPRTSDEIRETFLTFFSERGHKLLPPWPLVPIGDPTTMFTSAGMQQFKPHFMGEQKPPAARAATVQRSFRTGDIEEVGDLNHLTAFEMLGNFSFGDYFKQEAIAWAWELLTDIYQIPADRLHVTIFLDDDEAYGHWRDVGVEDTHIHRCGEEHNYWHSGPPGPCGPDSEIFFDWFPERGLKDAHPEDDDERFLEIWNLVFMTYFQFEDGSREELPAKNIDTGSGLERVAAVLQGKRSVYETDVFESILAAASEAVGEGVSDERDRTVRAMAEHCRAATLLVGDGVVPSNEGRGYVLRRILRRAIFLARRSGVREPFVPKVVEAVIGQLSKGYPHLEEQRAFILRALGGEEERFLRTLSTASARLDLVLARLTEAGESTVPGVDAFELYDTYGLPIELTEEISEFANFKVDRAGFESALEAQRKRARESGKFFQGEPSPALRTIDRETAFTGYDHLDGDAQLVGILQGDELIEAAPAGEECELILDTTPFYPEGGGQQGDRGLIRSPAGTFEVTDTQTSGSLVLHHGRVTEGEMRVATHVNAEVDHAWRSGAARNHTATHLLHASLRSVLGDHVRQQGSFVAQDRLRFDFTHLEQTSAGALLDAQQLVNEKVRNNLEVSWRNASYQSAIEEGALAFFGDKYGNEVRVVTIDDDDGRFSAELCGGTHAARTGNLGYVHVLRESAVAAGTRRIEAVTGPEAERYLLEQHQTLQRLAGKLSTSTADVETRVDALSTELESLRKQLSQLDRVQSAGMIDVLIEGAQTVAGANVVAARIDVRSRDALKEIADTLRQRLSSAVVVLGALIDGRPAMLAAATADLVDKGVHAGTIVKTMASAAGGGGGGRPDIAQAGGKDASKLDAAIEEGRKHAVAALDKL